MLPMHSSQATHRNIVSIFVLFALLSIAKCFEMNFDQFVQSTPSTYGLLTVTHARKGAYNYFQNHLNKYANMNCPQMTEISVVWNNDITPEQAGIKQDPSWKRPVYFRKTPFNSMDFRYLLPQQSKAKVFFCIDDDILTTCQQLTKSFALWRKQAVGDIGPLMSYGPRGFDFTTSVQKFNYIDPLNARFYSMSLIGVAWVSRFYFQLYNSQKSWQITQMRDVVREKNNCDDIALNFIATHFFPELVPIPLGGDLIFTIKPGSQGFTRTHYSFRNQCLKKFTQIFRYCPLRLINKADPGSADRFVSSALKYSVYFKRKQLAQRLIQTQKGIASSDISVQSQKLTSKLREQNTQLNKNSPNYKVSSTMRADKQQSIQQSAANRDKQQTDKQNEKIREQNIKLNKQIQKLNLQIATMRQKQVVLSTQGNNQKSISKSDDKRTKQEREQDRRSRIQNINSSINYITNASIIIGLFLFIILVYLLSNGCRQTSSQPSQEANEPIRMQQLKGKASIKTKNKMKKVTRLESDDSEQESQSK